MNFILQMLHLFMNYIEINYCVCICFHYCTVVFGAVDREMKLALSKDWVLDESKSDKTENFSINGSMSYFLL